MDDEKKKNIFNAIYAALHNRFNSFIETLANNCVILNVICDDIDLIRYTADLLTAYRVFEHSNDIKDLTFKCDKLEIHIAYLLAKTPNLIKEIQLYKLLS